MKAKPIPNDKTFGLNQLLSKWIRWLKIHRALQWGLRGLVIGLIGALMFLIGAVLSGRLLRSEFLQLSLVISSTGFIFGIFAGFVSPLPSAKAARLFDKRFQLKERISTAVELSDQKFSIHPGLIAQQSEDALQHARKVNPYRDFPLRFPTREFLVSLILVFSLVFIWLQFDSFFEIAQQRKLAKDAINREAQNIEALKNELDNDLNLSQQQREKITQPLDETLEQLGESDNLESAVSTLTQTEEHLQSIFNQQADTQSQTLQSLGESLKQNQTSPLQKFGENLSQENFSAAAEDLQNLDIEDLSQSEGEMLAQELEQSAEALEETTPEFAQELRETAEEIRNDNPTTAQSSLQRAAQTLNQINQGINQSNAAQQAVEQLQDSQRRLIETGRVIEYQRAGNQGAQSGERSQQGQFTQNGQTSQSTQDSSPENSQNQGAGGEGQNQDSSGAGAGEGTSNGSDMVGSEVGSSPINQDNEASDGGERGYEPIYSPQLLGGEDSAEIALPEGDQPGDIVVGERNISPEDPEVSKAPYIDVFPFYEQAARQAIDSGQIPIHLKSLIRDYFSSLEP